MQHLKANWKMSAHMYSQIEWMKKQMCKMHKKNCNKARVQHKCVGKNCEMLSRWLGRADYTTARPS